MKLFPLLTRAFCAAGMLWTLGSCSDSDDGQTPPAIQEIVISVSDITSQSANVTYKPSADDFYYFPSLMEKTLFDQFATDEDCIKDVISFLRAKVQSESTSMEEIVKKYGKAGLQSHVFDELTVGTEYIAYAVGISLDGTKSSNLFKKSFTIPVPGPSSNIISLEIKNIGADGAYISATTTNKDPYILDVWEASKLTGLTDEQIMDKVINGYEAGFWDKNLMSGNDNLDVRGRLDASTAHVVVAFGYEAGIKTTKLVKSPFTTKVGGWKECTFTPTATSLTSREATYKMTASDKTVPFYFSFIPASKFADESDATALAQLQLVIQDKFNNGWDYNDLLFYGEKSQTYKELKPKTDYYIVAVGMTNKGEVITNIFKQKVTTPDASATTVIFGTPTIAGRTVTVSVSAGANTPKWKACSIYSWSSVFTDEYMTYHLLRLVGENQATLSTTVGESDDAAHFYGIGIDANGNPGKIVTLKVPVQ